MKKKIALITGVNGQDGAYLSELLIKKNYNVHGILRRTANYKLGRLEYLNVIKKINFHHSELNEYKNIENLIKKIKPDVIFNLAAQSFVQYSFDNPFYTSEVNYHSVLNMLETIRRNKMDTKFYQASTSEMFGNTNSDKQNETTKFYPASPYAISKVSSHYLIGHYRKAYDAFFCSGILFNHESYLRGIEFVTKKIVNGLAKIIYENAPPIKLGNLDSKRDWGFAGDYVKAMELMISAKKADDYVVATGQTYSIREFIKTACYFLDIKPVFVGKGLNEVCYDRSNKKKLIIIDKKYFRENELHRLKGDPSKIMKDLKWKRTYNFKDLVEHMVKKEVDYFHNEKKIIF
ncbi:GDP-mannose 4,6-dehydratase [Candidatus Pelagibacter bacterium nBUS_27]|uniref:GDP-mannose 4,6-dehydratase n=1 Tax=Candidatus Pelagibacter bacterium nBUS_27 TaxID=3374188 RepID=UPI003EBDF0B4